MQETEYLAKEGIRDLDRDGSLKKLAGSKEVSLWHSCVHHSGNSFGFKKELADMQSFKTLKGTELPMLNLRGKDYLEVKFRLVWFREEHPDWGIETSVFVRPDGKSTLAEALIKDPSGRIMSMAHKVEDAAGFPDHTEKAETGAVGRALALCGYGTQFAPELEEGERIVDAPAQRARPLEKKEPVELPKASVVLNPGTVMNSFGKYKSNPTPIFKIPVHEHEADLAYWESVARKDGKPLGEKISNYLAAVRAYLDSKPEKTFVESQSMIPTVQPTLNYQGFPYSDDSGEDIPF